MMFKYLLLVVLLSSSSYSKALSISGNYKEFEGVQSYNLAVNYGIIDYEHIKSSKYFYKAAEANHRITGLPRGTTTRHQEFISEELVALLPL